MYSNGEAFRNKHFDITVTHQSHAQWAHFFKQSPDPSRSYSVWWGITRRGCCRLVAHSRTTPSSATDQKLKSGSFITSGLRSTAQRPGAHSAIPGEALLDHPAKEGSPSSFIPCPHMISPRYLPTLAICLCICYLSIYCSACQSLRPPGQEAQQSYPLLHHQCTDYLALRKDPKNEG